MEQSNTTDNLKMPPYIKTLWRVTVGLWFGFAIFLFATNAHAADCTDGDDAGAGHGTVAWLTPEDGCADNGAYPSANFNGTGGATSHYLLLSGFGFTIPGGSVIDGVEVVLSRADSTNGDRECRDETISIYDGTAVVGDNKAATTTDWPNAFADATYGGAADDWNAGLTADEVNSAAFGIAISAQTVNGTTGENCFVDGVDVTITYSANPDVWTLNSPIDYTDVFALVGYAGAVAVFFFTAFGRKRV